MNVLVGSMFALLFVIAALMAMGEQIWQKAHVYDDWYLQYNNKYPDFFPSFRGWVLGVSGAQGGSQAYYAVPTHAGQRRSRVQAPCGVALCGVLCMVSSMPTHTGKQRVTLCRRLPRVQVVRWVILLNGVIPISLYVTLEVVKVLQVGSTGTLSSGVGRGRKGNKRSC